jgi:hypothetical protein
MMLGLEYKGSGKMRCIGCWLLVLLLTGCVELPLQRAALRPSVVEAPTVGASVVEVPVIELSVTEDAVPVSVGSSDNMNRNNGSLSTSISQAERERIASILVLLERADLAIKNKRLAEPRGDNAAEYYRRVLKLHPGYQEATQGLDKIVTRYLQASDVAMRQGQDATALRYLALARQADPGSARVERSAAGLQSQRMQSQRQKPERVTSQDVKVEPVKPENITTEILPQTRYVRLDVQQLKAKSPGLVVALGALADHIQRENARVTIEAPTDSQGRWIYQQLNNRHEEYRVRANFRLEAQPGVRLLD